MTIIETAKAMSKRGYSVIPTDEKKNPMIWSWTPYMSTPMTMEEVDTHFKKAGGIALLMGGVKALTAIDFDLKYSEDPELYNKVLELIPSSIYKKMYIQKTRNGGYHWIFSCPNGVGNTKLAQRPTTDDEVATTLQQHIEGGVGVKEAMKLALNDKIRVLIETRSFTSHYKSGSILNKGDGYVLIPPSAGYEYVEGKIGVLSITEMDNLLSALRSFNTYTPPKIDLKVGNVLGKSIWDKANNSLDSLALLKDCGWKVIFENETDVRLLRPGQVSSTTSAVFHKETNIFVCFSSSTVFEPGKGYNPASLFIELECDGSMEEARVKLEEKFK